jgi:hypothetical protein
MRIAHVSTAEVARGRRGVVVIELLLVAPLLLIILLGTIEFALLLVARAQLVSACREGARVASHGGGDRDELQAEVRETVQRALGHGSLGHHAKVAITWHKEDLKSAQAEDHKQDHQPEHKQEHKHPRFGRDRVEVVVQVPAARVVPNFLAWAGFSIAARELSSRMVMNLE